MAELVAQFKLKNKSNYDIIDDAGKYDIRCNDKLVQRKLSHNEVIRYLANALEGK